MSRTSCSGSAELQCINYKLLYLLNTSTAACACHVSALDLPFCHKAELTILRLAQLCGKQSSDTVYQCGCTSV